MRSHCLILQPVPARRRLVTQPSEVVTTGVNPVQATWDVAASLTATQPVEAPSVIMRVATQPVEAPSVKVATQPDEAPSAGFVVTPNLLVSIVNMLDHTVSQAPLLVIVKIR